MSEEDESPKENEHDRLVKEIFGGSDEGSSQTSDSFNPWALLEGREERREAGEEVEEPVYPEESDDEDDDEDDSEPRPSDQLIETSEAALVSANWTLEEIDEKLQDVGQTYQSSLDDLRKVDQAIQKSSTSVQRTINWVNDPAQVLSQSSQESRQTLESVQSSVVTHLQGLRDIRKPLNSMRSRLRAQSQAINNLNTSVGQTMHRVDDAIKQMQTVLNRLQGIPPVPEARSRSRSPVHGSGSKRSPSPSPYVAPDGRYHQSEEDIPIEIPETQPSQMPGAPYTGPYAQEVNIPLEIPETQPSQIPGAHPQYTGPNAQEANELRALLTRTREASDEVETLFQRIRELADFNEFDLRERVHWSGRLGFWPAIIADMLDSPEQLMAARRRITDLEREILNIKDQIPAQVKEQLGLNEEINAILNITKQIVRTIRDLGKKINTKNRTLVYKWAKSAEQGIQNRIRQGWHGNTNMALNHTNYPQYHTFGVCHCPDCRMARNEEALGDERPATWRPNSGPPTDYLFM